tara:strand:+ start:1121 stop:1687 length:567 start_codon:yes stop_codon:yes gene_type:complete
MKYDIFLKGKIVDLICIDNNVVNNTSWYKWFNDKNLTKFTKQGYFPNTLSNQKKYFKENILSKKRVQLGVINKKKILIGMLALYEINNFDRTCSIASIFSKNYKQMNSLLFFKEAQSLMIDHAFNKMNLRRIEAAANDERLLEINKRLFGFKLEGVQREKDYIEGNYIDRFILGLLRKDWNSLKNEKK